MALDSFYYENILDNSLNRYLNRYRQKIEEGIEKAVEQLRGDFKKLEITYFFRGSTVIFKIERINTYAFDFNISFELGHFNYNSVSKEEIGDMLYHKIKYKILDYWDKKLLS